ncbi:hypothetical protein OKW43_001818 [Paraburkholderia sp. WC7.3g]
MRKSLVAVLLASGITSLSYGGDGNRSDGPEAGKQGEHRVLKVFDATGKNVGPVVTLGFFPGVVLHVSGATILVPISRPFDSGGQYPASQYQWGWLASSLGYPTTDCSGPPVVPAGGDASDILRPSIVVREGADATAYVAPDTHTTDVTLRSYVAHGKCAPDTSRPDRLHMVKGWYAESTYSLTQNYPEPLTIHY